MQAISLVSQALTLLESGKLNVLSFGESPRIILKNNEQFNGPNLIKSLNFDQNHSKIAELLDFIRTLNQDDPSSDNEIFENLLIVLSDGRNIFSEGEQKVKNAVKLARLQRIFIVYIIIDNPENKVSTLFEMQCRLFLIVYTALSIFFGKPTLSTLMILFFKNLFTINFFFNSSTQSSTSESLNFQLIRKRSLCIRI